MTTKKTTYSSVGQCFTKKINAYKTLYNHTTGGSYKYRPTPVQLNSFSKWIDKGAVVHNISCTQLNRWARTSKDWTPGTAKTWLCSQYGKTCIKAVTGSKTGGFLVATNQSYKNKPFKFSR